MILLELKNGTTVRFNLKSKSREKNLYNAWYSMCDMPQYASKKLKMTTDKGVGHEYTVEEIKKCLFIDKIFDYGSSSVAPIAIMEPKVWENSQNKVASGDLEKVIKEIATFLKNLFEELPEDMCIENGHKLIDGIRKNNVPVDAHDSFLKKMILETMQAPEDRVYFFVTMYVQYWHQTRQQ